ncbi:transforming acidic coiled-coil-containing protein 1-like [Brachionichthys hirsutus]|uniref:transforming acidic coiled-coil-containing protein 1-like n=1 Tax=Brachionichthys hirsutus TaxID=412623 RepID=UPI0036048E03
MSWLSPVSWAKWTWTAVRGGEEEEEEEDKEGVGASKEREQRGARGKEEEEEEEEEERSQGCSSDSEGHFDTPEAATPVRVPPPFPGEVENNSDPDKAGGDKEERLIVTAPVGQQHDMGQGDPADPMGGPLKESIQAREVDLGPEPVPASTIVMDMPEVAPSFEQDLVPVPEVTPTAAPGSDPTPEPDLDRINEPAPSLTPEPSEQKPPAEPEPYCNDLSHTEPIQKTETKESKPPPLNVTVSWNDVAQTNGEPDLPIPKGSYKFDPDQLDDCFNPFTSGGCKIPNSPPPCGPNSTQRFEPLGDSLSLCNTSSAVSADGDMMGSSSEAKTVMLELGLDEGPVSQPARRKLGGKKTVSKLASKKRKPMGSEASIKPAGLEPDSQPALEPDSQPALESDSKPASETLSNPLVETALPSSDSTAPLNLDDVPIPKTGMSNFDPSQWDDPNFNPFGSNNQMSSSPVLKKSFRNLDPDNSDDTLDPFKPSKTINTDDSSFSTPQPGKKEKARGKPKAAQPAGENKEKQIPKKSKARTAPNTCKDQKHDESQASALDLCREEEVVGVQTPEITQQVHHATDEEKLASTCIMGTTADGQEEKGEPEWNNTPAKKLPVSDISAPDGAETKTVGHIEDVCSLKDDLSEILTSQTAKMTSSEGSDMPALSQDSGTPLSEMDKAGVLAQIREEIITKEIEVNEWKRKYEESRAEVLEMRKIVAEYEKTVAQMIEDEQQQKTLSCNKSIKQLSAERDQAIADLNSVERSFADLFRRYENMKGVLEGFKKNEEVLKKCAQEYLMRIKQEELRYQTLKVHAEEKLDKANEDIAQVRSKANAEGIALNASLRKEQMKVESLERAVLQKNQEIEELTKICDELISKLGTGGGALN